ncbi:tRNA (guanine(37)-N1)-methyltransferase 1 [Ananas comosus]|uniref:tRNA (guanine(37)-N1)-methyltransferase n=1 Tax=Ananas comosus TaxID=4615 RepID=A0A199UZA0_ANACO|nr:tRNA (guanine(37)-N1)-methyltransferase 1 [Ananas comosus]
MSSAFALRTRHHFPFSFPPIPSPRRLLPTKPYLFYALSSNLTVTLAADPAASFHYGPSLRHGRRPPPPPPPADEGGAAIDRSSFIRSFDVAALRVPAAECSALEARLRGHLLNWPRVRNVARVAGDDVEPELRRMLRGPAEGDGGARLDSLARRAQNTSHIGGGGGEEEEEPLALSPALYREKLAKEFNCRGYLKFRNLAKISRPKKRKEKGRKKEESREGLKERAGKNEFSAIEVVSNGDDDGDEEEEDMRGLLGDEFGGRRWRGPTRLLLLDERYANKAAEELPEAVKAVLCGDSEQIRPSVYELVRCRLTLFYDYWQMSELLEALLPEGMIVPTGFETVGHIVHLNLRDEHLPYKKLIAQVVLDKNKPKIQTVVNKIDAIQNDYRTMQLEVLAGNHSLVTTVIENGIRFQVDLATVYWNSRLATERHRLVNNFTSSDVVCDVFSGVGPIAISAARKVKHVYANDLNPNAVEYLERNIVLNKLERKIEVFNMDGRRFIGAIFASQRPYAVTQVVMNLPNAAAEFLDVFRGISRNRMRDDNCTLPKIHVYGFSKAQNPEYDFCERINMALCDILKDVELHRVRLVVPGKWMLCASFTLPRAVAFAKQPNNDLV